MEKETKEKMKKSIEHFTVELKNIRTGRASPGILDGVKVDVYGTSMRLQDIASVSVPEPMQLLIVPFDASNSASIGKAIEKANLGFQPITEGNQVRINIPPMDGTIRQKMIRTIGELLEQTKVSIRQVRKEANDHIKANKDFSEDEKKGQEKKVQDLTDQYCKEAEEMAKKKEEELSSV